MRALYRNPRDEIGRWLARSEDPKAAKEEEDEKRVDAGPCGDGGDEDEGGGEEGGAAVE